MSRSLCIYICHDLSASFAGPAPHGLFARRSGWDLSVPPVCLHYSAMQIDCWRITIIRFNICSLSRRYYNSSGRPRVYLAICQLDLAPRAKNVWLIRGAVARLDEISAIIFRKFSLPRITAPPSGVTKWTSHWDIWMYIRQRNTNELRTVIKTWRAN